MNVGVIPMYGSLIPWTSPVGIGAFLGYGSVNALVFAFVQLAIAVAIYYPFVIVSNRIAAKEAEDAKQTEAK